MALDVPHHATQLGNNRQTVFHSDSDRWVYLDLLFRSARANELSLMGYCLMPNHVHLIAALRRPDSMALTFRDLPYG